MVVPITLSLEFTMAMNAINETDFNAFLDSIRTTYGYDFTEYAESSLKRRIAYFMEMRKIGEVESLARLILRDEHLFEEFVQEMSITVTEMFRDPSFYKTIREKLIERLATYPVIKIWIAGCATGQEVYSLAILLKEHQLLDRAIIYATDINQKSLRIAKEGVYPIENMKAYTENYLKAGGMQSFSEYYLAKYQSVMFDKDLRQNVVFAPHNLVTDRAFNEFQFIICRNVLMYFNQNLQRKVIDIFYESLSPFCFLGLGDKESLLFSDKKPYFEEVDKKEKIYKKVL
jgi:chemotaxis protein methyltransferase CheR